MAQRTLPFLDGMALGRGVNDLSGQISSIPAVTVGTPVSAEGDTGMSASYETLLVHSVTQLYSALDVKVGGEVGFAGIFDVGGKYEFAERVGFNTSSTFLVARAQIASSFLRIDEPQPVDDAKELFRLGKLEQFRKRYGDGFIRGTGSGGEYVAVIAITAAAEEQQRELGVALKAGFDAIVASGEIEGEYQEKINKLSQRSEVRVAIYQRGGTGEQISYTGTVAEVVQRLRTFSTAVKESPKAFSAQVASYDTLVFPRGPDEFNIKRQQDVLADCARQQLELKTNYNDVAMVLAHPEYYESPPDRGVLSRWSEELADLLNGLEDHAEMVRDDPQKAKVKAFKLPADLALPKRRLHSSEKVEVFNLPDYGRAVDGGPTPRAQTLGLGSYETLTGTITVGNDQIKSLKVPEGLAVRAYEHSWFQGDTIDFTEDMSSLGSDWTDKISALTVYKVADGPPRVTQIVALDFPWNRWLILGPGKFPDLGATALGADMLSTLLIPAGMMVRLWDEAGFQGASGDFVSDVIALPPDWDNRAGSMEIIDMRAPA